MDWDSSETRIMPPGDGHSFVGKVSLPSFSPSVSHSWHTGRWKWRRSFRWSQGVELAVDLMALSLQVVSTAMMKTVMVAIDRMKYFPKYRHYLRRTRKFMVRHAMVFMIFCKTICCHLWLLCVLFWQSEIAPKPIYSTSPLISDFFPLWLEAC